LMSGCTCLPAKEPENASDGNRDYLYERTGPLHTNYPCPEQPHFLVLLLVSKYMKSDRSDRDQRKNLKLD
jgi:hypothetical protein